MFWWFVFIAFQTLEKWFCPLQDSVKQKRSRKFAFCRVLLMFIERRNNSQCLHLSTMSSYVSRSPILPLHYPYFMNRNVYENEKKSSFILPFAQLSSSWANEPNKKNLPSKFFSSFFCFFLVFLSARFASMSVWNQVEKGILS